MPALTLLVLAALAPLPAADPGERGSRAGAPGTALTRALEQERLSTEPSFHLRVDCTDERGSRKLEVFPSGVAFWNDRVQLPPAPALRAGLLEDLLRHDFASLEPSYGGRARTGEPKAALRISCRVSVDLAGLAHSSTQSVYGEQSRALAGLADALLDRAERLTGGGTAAADLDDGLAKLASGVLAPEALRLRFVDLPPRRGEPGTLLEIAGGVLSLRPYAPGSALGEERSVPLSRERLAALADDLRQADVASLPVNLWDEGHLELDVEVLGHRQAVVARPFSRLADQRSDETRERFARLVEALRALR